MTGGELPPGNAPRVLADDPPRQSGRGEGISAPRCRPGTEPRRKRPHGDRARDPPHGISWGLAETSLGDRREAASVATHPVV